MTSALRIDIAATRGHTTALTAAGELDLMTAPALYRRVQESFGGRGAVLLELSGLTFCDSSGLNSLIRLRRRAQETDGRLVLVAPSPQMARLLTVTGVGEIFEIQDSLRDAWAAHPVPGTPPRT
ncbi:STAS domain-containing protein [Kitasatospora sp. MBT63]|uniref:STAS domain-containing protein n=1 Tax=Kitasatospora sp. MBT63 TaxID=1444768 RepID=UPI000539621F|nr:STAS domain-containing protein [Kitasatospora sp. MBT63]